MLEATANSENSTYSDARTRFLQIAEERAYARGWKHGYAKGWKRGYAKGIRNALFSLLDFRGIHITTDARERILACEDPDTLLAWVVRTLHIHDIHELFDAAPQD